MDEQNIIISEELKSFSKSFAFAYSLKSPKNMHLLDELLSLTSFLDDVYDNITIGQRAWHIKNNNFSLQLCPICGKPMHYDSRYKLHYDCGQKKAKNTLNSKSKKEWNEIVSKQKETNLKKYGVSNVMQSEKVKEKVNQINLEKCGSIRQSSLPEVKEKIIKTQTELYGGVGNQSKILLKKHNSTCLERYGGIGFQSPELRKKHIETCRKLYGVDLYYSSKEFEDRRMAETSFIKSIQSLADIQYVRRKNERIHILRCNKCGKEFEISSSNRYRLNNGFDLCIYCNPINNHISNLEMELQKFISTIYKKEINFNCRNIIKKPDSKFYLELDVYLPDLKLAIEFNGDQYHANPKFYKEDDTVLIINKKVSDIWEKDRVKKELCEEKGIKLITIWENDWINNNYNTKIYVINCINQRRKELKYERIK